MLPHASHSARISARTREVIPLVQYAAYSDSFSNELREKNKAREKAKAKKKRKLEENLRQRIRKTRFGEEYRDVALRPEAEQTPASHPGTEAKAPPHSSRSAARSLLDAPAVLSQAEQSPKFIRQEAKRQEKPRKENKLNAKQQEKQEQERQRAKQERAEPERKRKPAIDEKEAALEEKLKQLREQIKAELRPKYKRDSGMLDYDERKIAKDPRDAEMFGIEPEMKTNKFDNDDDDGDDDGDMKLDDMKFDDDDGISDESESGDDVDDGEDSDEDFDEDETRTGAENAPKGVFTKTDISQHFVRCKLGLIAMPKAYTRRITQRLKNYNKDSVKMFGENMRAMINARRTNRASEMLYNEGISVAFLKYRSAPSYAISKRIFSEIARAKPDFSPQRVLDFGCGPAAAAWAAYSTWGDVIRNIDNVESSPFMSKIAEFTLFGLPPKCQVIPKLPQHGEYDLINMSNVIGEYDERDMRKSILQSLIGALAPGGMLVLAEPGTPEGAMVVWEARSSIIERPDLSIIAPCPHNGACPLEETLKRLVLARRGKVSGEDLVKEESHSASMVTWCHFSQRYRLESSLVDKKLPSNWSDTKFSYLVVSRSRELVDSKLSRVLAPPQKKGGHVLLQLCTPKGEARRIAATKVQGKSYYKASRKTSWGDLFRIRKLK